MHCLGTQPPRNMNPQHHHHPPPGDFPFPAGWPLMPSQPSSRTKREKQPPTRAVPAKLQPSATHKVRGICRENVPPASRALAIPPSRPSSSPAPATQRFMPRSVSPDEQRQQPAERRPRAVDPPPLPTGQSSGLQCQSQSLTAVRPPSTPAPPPITASPALGSGRPPKSPIPPLVRGQLNSLSHGRVAEQAGPEIF